jgi:hypothetical protein
LGERKLNKLSGRNTENKMLKNKLKKIVFAVENCKASKADVSNFYAVNQKKKKKKKKASVLHYSIDF